MQHVSVQILCEDNNYRKCIRAKSHEDMANLCAKWGGIFSISRWDGLSSLLYAINALALTNKNSLSRARASHSFE